MHDPAWKKRKEPGDNEGKKVQGQHRPSMRLDVAAPGHDYGEGQGT